MPKSNLDVFQVVADQTRREILRLLAAETLTVNALASKFEMSRPAVSKHIKILSHSGFISIEVKGRERHCALNEEGFRGLQEWISWFDGFLHSKPPKLNKFLKTQRNGPGRSRG